MSGASTPVLILADANLLVKDVVSASFFDLNKAKLISMHWTPEIEAEYVEHRARIRARQIGHATQEKDLHWAAARIDVHKKYLVPSSTPVGWDEGVTLTGMMADPKYASLKTIPDPNDIHVAMAAAFMAESLKRPVVLATHNLGDLPQPTLEPFHVVVLHPGVILEMLHQKHPKAVAASLLKTCQDFQDPKITQSEFLKSISGSNQFDNPDLAKLIQAEWRHA